MPQERLDLHSVTQMCQKGNGPCRGTMDKRSSKVIFNGKPVCTETICQSGSSCDEMNSHHKRNQYSLLPLSLYTVICLSNRTLSLFLAVCKLFTLILQLSNSQGACAGSFNFNRFCLISKLCLFAL